MAASSVSKSFVRGLGLPWLLTDDSIWDAQASFSQHSPQPGQAQPQGAYVMQLDTSGTQSASKSLQVRTQRAGHPGPGGAGLVWKNTADTNWRGRDVQQISGFVSVKSTITSGVTACADPDVAALPDGTLFVVYQREMSTGDQYRVTCSVSTDDGGTWTDNDLYVKSISPTDGYHPCVAIDEKGYIYVAHWIFDGNASTAQVRVHRSIDKGVTWTAGSLFALDIPVDISGAVGAGTPGYEVQRLRMAFNAGQCLLVAQVTANNSTPTNQTGLAQYASTSDAMRFQQVELTTGVVVPENLFFGHHSVDVSDGAFVILYAYRRTGFTGSYQQTVRLPSAYAKISVRLNANVVAAFALTQLKDSGGGVDCQTVTQVITDGDGAGWVDSDGTIYSLFRQMTGSAAPGQVFGRMSTDGGLTWKYYGDGDSSSQFADDATVYYTGGSADYITGFAGCSVKGRQFVVHTNVGSSSSNDASIHGFYMGGYSTVTHNGVPKFPDDYQQGSWTHTWNPIELPGNEAVWTKAGAGTEAIVPLGVALATTGANVSYYSANPTPASVSQVVVRAVLEVGSGGSTSASYVILRIVTGNNTTDYDAELRFSTTGFRLYDNEAGANIGGAISQTMTSPVDVTMAFDDGQVSVWYRVHSLGSDRDWTLAYDNQAMQDGGAGTNLNTVLFGNGTSNSTSTSTWREVNYAIGTHIDMGSGQNNPSELQTRTYPRRGRTAFIDDGVLISTRFGSAVRAENYLIETAYEFPIERILYSRSPTPRVQWRSLSGAPPSEQFIPFVLNTTAGTLGAEEQGVGNALMFFHGAGTNFRTFTIERRDTAGPTWAVEATIDIGTSFTGTRRGSEVIPGGATSSGVWVAENELKGWYVDLTGNDIRKVRGNSAGVLAGSGSASKKVSIFLEGVDDTEASSGTFNLFPDRWTILIPIEDETAAGWALRIGSQSTSEGYIGMGQFLMGRVWVPGMQYANGRVISFLPNTPTEEQPDGIMRGIEMGPGFQELRLTWSDLNTTDQLWGPSSDPDYRNLTGATGTFPLAVVQDVGLSLIGIAREVGERLPLVYLPKINSTNTSNDTITNFWGHLLCTLTGEVQIEHVTGGEFNSNAGAGETFRVATLPLREVT